MEYLSFRWKQLSWMPTGLGDQSTGTLVERILEILQTGALSQSGQAHRLQGPSLGGFPYNGGLENLHVAVMQLLPLLRAERLGLVLFMVK